MVTLDRPAIAGHTAGGGGGIAEKDEDAGDGAPPFASVTGVRSPLGYGTCEAGVLGWHAQSRAWDHGVLFDHGAGNGEDATCSSDE